MAEQQGAAEVSLKPFVLIKRAGAIVRVSAIPEVEIEGQEPVIGEHMYVDENNVIDLTKEQMGELYGILAGVGPKNFKNKEIAIESIAYQAAKMGLKAATATAAPAASGEPAAKEPKAPKVPKTAEELAADAAKKAAEKEAATTFTLLTPANQEEALKGLAPQARAVLSAMGDVVKETGSATFTGKQLDDRLKREDTPLSSRQPPMRIVTYYKQKLTDAGFLQK